MEDKKKRKKTFSVLNVLLLLIIFLIVLYIVLPCGCPTKKEAMQIVCQTCMHELFTAISAYKEAYQEYPAPVQWCESIKESALQTGMEEENSWYLCPFDSIGPCSYAMNENIPADVNELLPDMVLLFESAPGWNQTGGPEDAITDRHDTLGAAITFADGHVESSNPKTSPISAGRSKNRPCLPDFILCETTGTRH